MESLYSDSPFPSSPGLTTHRGLDTSFCVKYLSEDRGMDVYSVLVDTGGFSAAELATIEARAYSLGVKSHKMPFGVAVVRREHATSWRGANSLLSS